MFLLDTNILSEPARPAPDPRVLGWLDQHMPVSYLCTPVLCELLLGVTLTPVGARHHALAAYIAESRLRFGARILAFDEAAADRTARLIAHRRQVGRPLTDVFDAEIAGIAQVHRLTVVTRNVSDFDGVGLTIINPWEAE